MNMKMLKKMWITAVSCSHITQCSILWHLYDIFISYIFHGCTFREYKVGEFYKLRNFERKKVVTYRRYKEIQHFFNAPDYIHFLANKVDFNKHFGAFIKRGWLYSRETNPSEMESFINRHKKIIVKPIDAKQGQGVHILKNDSSIELTIKKLLQENVLVEQFIEQDHRMCFNNASVNTIRIYSVMDGNSEVHIIKAILRVGIGQSVVDNYCAGGVIYPVNPQYGIIEGLGQDHNRNLYFCHPGTDTTMLGYKIPRWEELLTFVKKAALNIPEVRFVGWDVVVTPTSFEMIEANHTPDLELLEFIGKKFFYKQIMSYK